MMYVGFLYEDGAEHINGECEMCLEAINMGKGGSCVNIKSVKKITHWMPLPPPPKE